MGNVSLTFITQKAIENEKVEVFRINFVCLLFSTSEILALCLDHGRGGRPPVLYLSSSHSCLFRAVIVLSN